MSDGNQKFESNYDNAQSLSTFTLFATRIVSGVKDLSSKVSEISGFLSTGKLYNSPNESLYDQNTSQQIIEALKNLVQGLEKYLEEEKDLSIKETEDLQKLIKDSKEIQKQFETSK